MEEDGGAFSLIVGGISPTAALIYHSPTPFLRFSTLTPAPPPFVHFPSVSPSIRPLYLSCSRLLCSYLTSIVLYISLLRAR